MMFSQYFGNYLLNKGLIGPEQLKEAMDYQSSTHIKLGVLAINAGYMTAEQVKEVHSLQKKVDKKFGEISVESGYLTGQQLEGLLATQKQGHLFLSQTLIDRGYLTLEQLYSALDAYKKEFSLSGERFEAVQQGDINEIVNIFVDFGTNANAEVYSYYISLMIRNLIVFIDSRPRLEKSYFAKEFTPQWIASQQIYGGINIFTALAADEKAFLYLAEKYADENIGELDELAQSSSGEFLNLHNGLFLLNMSNLGKELEMSPQVVRNGKDAGPLNNVFVIPIHIGGGKINVIICGGMNIA